MNKWDVMSWVSVAILGPGALMIFMAFLIDLKRLLNQPLVSEEEASLKG